MEKAKSRWFRAFVIGGLVGGIAATWLGPKAIAWYWTPPVEYAFNCKAPIEWALHRLQVTQMAGIIVGGIGAMILYIALAGRRKSNGFPTQPN